MPWGDRTGPMGAGPMTGRGAGYCAGFDVPGYANPFGGRMGLGWRRGGGFGWGGRGWRHQYYATGQPGWARFGYPPAWAAPEAPWVAAPTREQEVEALRQQTEFLKGELDAINKRMADLEEKDQE